MWLPKFTCWKICLERNNNIFREESCRPHRVATKFRVLLGEALEAKVNLRNASALDVDYDLWLKGLVPILKLNSPPIPHATANWEISLGEQDFFKWRSTLGDHCLFFDGASKGNLGAVGGGGVLLIPEGLIHMNYAWGLGHESNNRSEALVLW